MYIYIYDISSLRVKALIIVLKNADIVRLGCTVEIFDREITPIR